MFGWTPDQINDAPIRLCEWFLAFERIENEVASERAADAAREAKRQGR